MILDMTKLKMMRTVNTQKLMKKYFGKSISMISMYMLHVMNQLFTTIIWKRVTIDEPKSLKFIKQQSVGWSESRIYFDLVVIMPPHIISPQYAQVQKSVYRFTIVKRNGKVNFVSVLKMILNCCSSVKNSAIRINRIKQTRMIQSAPLEMLGRSPFLKKLKQTQRHIACQPISTRSHFFF